MTSDREEVLEFLLESGANLYLKAAKDSKWGRGKTAFHLAAASGQVTELGLMLQKMEQSDDAAADNNAADAAVVNLCQMKDSDG